MKTVDDLINGKTTQQLAESGQQSSESAQQKEPIRWLWQMMGSMFGHKWVSSYGETVDPDRVWAACLKGISPEQIKHGLNACVTSGLEWPPSAPEFRALCTDDADREWRAFKARSDETDRLLAAERLRLTDQGKVERAKVAGSSTLDALRSMFGGTAPDKNNRENA